MAKHVITVMTTSSQMRQGGLEFQRGEALVGLDELQDIRHGGVVAFACVRQDSFMDGSRSGGTDVEVLVGHGNQLPQRELIEAAVNLLVGVPRLVHPQAQAAKGLRQFVGQPAGLLAARDEVPADFRRRALIDDGSLGGPAAFVENLVGDVLPVARRVREHERDAFFGEHAGQPLPVGAVGKHEFGTTAQQDIPRFQHVREQRVADGPVQELAGVHQGRFDVVRELAAGVMLLDVAVQPHYLVTVGPDMGWADVADDTWYSIAHGCKE